MSVLNNSEVTDIVAKIGDVCLNENFSDVVFIVNGERLPAHQVILGQRCPVFKAMFSPNNEFKKHVVELPETPLEAFKLLLKFVYTGAVELDAVSIATVFDAMTLANTYEMPGLTEFCIDHLKFICGVENVVDILNKAIQKSQETLIDYCIEYVGAPCIDFIGHESFYKLPVQAVQCILKKPISKFFAESVFCAFVGWMKANPSESKHFPKLLKMMDLKSMSINEIVDTIRPLNLVDANVLLDIMCEHAKKAKYPDDNVLAPHYKTRVLTGGSSTFFTIPDDGVLKHRHNENILIQLDGLYMLSYLRMQLSKRDHCYWIEVSEDNVNWTRIIDYSKYVCRSLQRLFFEERPVRYIRIHGGCIENNQTLKIKRLAAYYLTDAFEVDPQTGIVIPTHNVVEKSAVVIEGEGHPDRNGMINGSTLSGCTWHGIGHNFIIVQLPQPYMLDSMKLLFGGDYSYSYIIEVSTDKKKWARVWSEQNVASWRHVNFDKQPVVFIKLTGLYPSLTNLFCKYLECPALA